MRVWTRQHKSVLDELNAYGRYAAGRGGVYLDLGEHAPLVLEAYDWLSAHHPLRAQRMVRTQPVVGLQHERRVFSKVQINAASPRGISSVRVQLIEHTFVLPGPYPH